MVLSMLPFSETANFFKAWGKFLIEHVIVGWLDINTQKENMQCPKVYTTVER